MPLALPQLALLCVDLCLYGTLWRCLLAGVAFSEPPVGALSGYIVIPELPGVVDGTSAPLRPACDFPWLRRSRPAPSTAVALRGDLNGARPKAQKPCLLHKHSKESAGATAAVA